MAPITAPVTFTVFPRSSRTAGTYLSASAQIPEGVYAITINDTMTNAQASNTSNRFIMRIYVSPTGQDGTWQSIWSEAWRGGTHFDRFLNQTVPNKISIAWSNSELASGDYFNWFCRGEVDQPVTMSAGFTVTVAPVA